MWSLMHHLQTHHGASMVESNEVIVFILITTIAENEELRTVHGVQFISLLHSIRFASHFSIVVIYLFMTSDLFDFHNVFPGVHSFTQFTDIRSAGEIWSCHLHSALHKFAAVQWGYLEVQS